MEIWKKMWVGVFSEHSVLAVAGTVLSVLPWLLTLARENNRRQVSISDARRLSILWCWKLFSLSSYSPTVPIPLSHFPHLSPGFWWHCEKCSSFCITEKVSGKLESAVFLIGYQYGKEFHIFVIRTGKWHLSGERCHINTRLSVGSIDLGKTIFYKWQT